MGRDRFAELVTEVVTDEGFRVNPDKTSVTTAARRQSVLGAVVNVRPTLARRERDALRALLHNCATHGWAGQTRGPRPGDLPRARARPGRLGHVRGPAFGARLSALADRIDWSASGSG